MPCISNAPPRRCPHSSLPPQPHRSNLAKHHLRPRYFLGRSICTFQTELAICQLPQLRVLLRQSRHELGWSNPQVPVPAPKQSQERFASPRSFTSATGGCRAANGRRMLCIVLRGQSCALYLDSCLCSLDGACSRGLMHAFCRPSWSCSTKICIWCDCCLNGLPCLSNICFWRDWNHHFHST